jgi:hypothetical protein
MRALSEDEVIARLLARLRMPGALLARDPRRGDFALHPNGDRRRRPTARAPARVIQKMLADGALIELAKDDRYVLSGAGRARALRDRAGADEAFRSQHQSVGPRAVIDRDGDVHVTRGVDPGDALNRLERMSDARGGAYFTPSEIAAARALRADWEAGQRGMVRASDWAAPPRGSTPRGPNAGAELAHAGAIDARRRFAQAMNTLAPALASAVSAACLQDEGFAEIERAQAWPARSAKLAVKLGLAQLARHYRC